MRTIPQIALIVFVVFLLPACSEGGSNPIADFLIKYLNVLTLSDDDQSAEKEAADDFEPTYEKDGLIYDRRTNEPYTGNTVEYEEIEGDIYRNTVEYYLGIRQGVINKKMIIRSKKTLKPVVIPKEAKIEEPEPEVYWRPECDRLDPSDMNYASQLYDLHCIDMSDLFKD